MNSVDRHEARYQRRKAKRDAAKERANASRTFEDVFSFSNIYESGRKCCLSVGWKKSTQLYKANATYNAAIAYRDLANGEYKPKGFYEFDIFERGKPRHIKAVHIVDRVVQRCLCDHALTPLLERSFIYDNGASSVGKGITFALDRMETHLHRYYRKYGADGYVLTFDVHHYFDSIPHELFFSILNKAVSDEKIRKLTMDIVNMFGDIGMGLGSQVSQIAALAVLNPLDHFIKEKLGIKYYARYMDDGYLIHQSKAYLQKCKHEIIEFCRLCGFELNENKTQIRPLRSGVRFLKVRFILTETGKVVRLPYRKSITNMRYKLRKFKKWVDDPKNKFSMDDVKTSYESWKGHMRHCNSWRTLQRMDIYYNKLFNTEDK